MDGSHHLTWPPPSHFHVHFIHFQEFYWLQMLTPNFVGGNVGQITIIRTSKSPCPQTDGQPGPMDLEDVARSVPSVTPLHCSRPGDDSPRVILHSLISMCLNGWLVHVS